MNATVTKTSRATRTFALAALCVPLSSFAVPSSSAAADAVQARCVPPLANVRVRVLEHAARGIDDLRRFVFITRGIYGLYVVEEAQWAEGMQRTIAACRSAAPSDGVASE